MTHGATGGSTTTWSSSSGTAGRRIDTPTGAMPYWILAVALALIANVVCLRFVAALRRRYYIGADRRWWQTGWRVATTAIVALASGWAFGSYAERNIEWAIPLYLHGSRLRVSFCVHLSMTTPSIATASARIVDPEREKRT